MPDIPNVLSYLETEILETEIEYLSPSDLEPGKICEDASIALDRIDHLWGKYKSVFLALGLIAFSLAFWYWINRSIDSSSGDSGNNSSTSIRDGVENPPNFDDISSIGYGDRGFVRRSIRDSFFEDPRLITRLRERNEDLALDSINLNLSSGGREEMIQRIRDSDASPNTVIDAVQALLREGVRAENPTFSNALVPYNSITDLVIYNPDTIPIPPTVDMSRYEIFIQYLDHYDAIIAAYGV